MTDVQNNPWINRHTVVHFTHLRINLRLGGPIDGHHRRSVDGVLNFWPVKSFRPCFKLHILTPSDPYKFTTD